MAEELTRLRKAGKATPSLAVWSVANAGSTMYTGLLPVYHNYTDIMLRSDSGTLIYFVDGDGNANGPDASVVDAIEGDGLPINVVQMWANLDTNRTNAGEWSFFQPCADITTGKFTLTVRNAADYRCNHLTTYNSPLGSMASVAFAWQVGLRNALWRRREGRSGWASMRLCLLACLLQYLRWMCGRQTMRPSPLPVRASSWG